jgi:hypothetical protein
MPRRTVIQKLDRSCGYSFRIIERNQDAPPVIEEFGGV